MSVEFHLASGEILEVEKTDLGNGTNQFKITLITNHEPVGPMDTNRYENTWTVPEIS